MEKRQSRVARLAVMAIALIALLVFAANMGLCVIGLPDKAHLRLAYLWREGGVLISLIREHTRGLKRKGVRGR